MSMDRLRQAVGNTIREADGVVHQSKHRGDQAVIYDAAKSVLDAPRLWLCELYSMYRQCAECGGVGVGDREPERQEP